MSTWAWLPAVSRVSAVVVDPGARGRDALFLQDLIRRIKEGAHPAQPQISHSLVQNLLRLGRSHAGPQRGRQLLPVFRHALAAQQCGENGHHPGLLIQAALVHNFAQSEVGEELHEFRVRIPQGGRVPREQTGQIIFGRCGKCHAESLLCAGAALSFDNSTLTLGADSKSSSF